MAENNETQSSSTVNTIFKGIGGALRSLSDGYKKNFAEIQTSSVYKSLEEVRIKKSQYTTEKNIEDIILKHLNYQIGKAHAQYNIGGYLGLKVDIDLGDGHVGVELKLAKELKGNASAIERLFGQVVYYSKRKYKEKLIVAIVGQESEYDQMMKEIEKFVKELNVNFIYITVTK